MSRSRQARWVSRPGRAPRTVSSAAMCPVALRVHVGDGVKRGVRKVQLAAGKPGEDLVPRPVWLEPAEYRLGPLGRQQRLVQRLQPPGGPRGLAAEQPGQPGLQHAPGAASLVVKPVFVAAVAAHRSGRGACAPGAQVLPGAAAGQQPAALAAAGALALGAHRRPVARRARRAIPPDHRHLAPVTAVGAFPFLPRRAASAQHLPGALAAARALPAALPAPRHGAGPAAPAQFRVTSGRQPDDDTHPPAPPAGAGGAGSSSPGSGAPRRPRG